MGGGEQEEIFNKIINEIAPFALDTLWPEIKPVIDNKAKEVKFLSVFSIYINEA